jgi:hypothetical protein
MDPKEVVYVEEKSVIGSVSCPVSGLHQRCLTFRFHRDMLFITAILSYSAVDCRLVVVMG